MLLILGFLSFSCEKDQEEMQMADEKMVIQNPGCEIYTDLIAGQFTDVGDVKASINGNTLLVEYFILDDCWCIAETHLDVQLSPDQFPMTKNGNPKVGHFAYGEELPECTDYWYTEVNLTTLGWDGTQAIYIAAHAVVETFDLGGYTAALPAQETLTVAYPGPGAYFYTTISGPSFLNGIYPGWCIDTDNAISINTPYTVNVFSSYDPNLPDYIVEHPENLDLVNWLLAQDWVGQASTCGGNYTFGDVQRAIWTLVEDNLSTSGLGAWSACRVNELLADAYANGEGYEPECNEFIAVIFQPVGLDGITTIAQITIAYIPYERFGEETAWGDGEDFPGNQWAMYFELYCVD